MRAPVFVTGAICLTRNSQSFCHRLSSIALHNVRANVDHIVQATVGSSTSAMPSGFRQTECFAECWLAALMWRSRGRVGLHIEQP